MENRKRKDEDLLTEESEKKQKTDSQDWMQELEEKGYCVIPGVLSKEKSAEYVSKFWDWLESFKSGVDRTNPKTWTNSKLPYHSHGIIQHFAIGHAQFVWDIRSEDSVIDKFAKIWGTEKLLVSFDGANFSRVTNHQSKPWPHVDQGPKKVGRVCVQGLVNLLDSGPKDGGLLVYEGSHKLHARFFKENKLQDNPGDWYKFSDMSFFSKCKPIKICCNAGDMILWDSRTVHYAEQPKGNTYRMVVYVSMLPAKGVPESQIKKKKQAFENKRTTSHWAVPVKLFPKNPHTYGNNEKIEKFKVTDELPVLTEKGKKLAGLVPY